MTADRWDEPPADVGAARRGHVRGRRVRATGRDRCAAGLLAMQQLVTRVDDRLVAAIDSLVADGVFGSRSDAVRVGLRIIVDRHRRAQVAAEIVEAYQAQPQTNEEYSWGDDATRDMIADEPW